MKEKNDDLLLLDKAGALFLTRRRRSLCRVGGNMRSVISDWDGLRQETNYYPSGLPYPNHHSKDGYNPEFQPYKFGGKELDEMNGLRSYDFHARQRKMDIPVFDTMDPLCEKYPRYGYASA